MNAKSGKTAIQFISFTYSGDASAKEKRKAHSHAARVAHGKLRRQRTIEYQDSKTGSTKSQSREHKEPAAETTPKGCDILSLNADEADQPALSIFGFLASDRRDPFSCFARRFEPIEHFLLDHYVRAVIPYMNVSCNKLQDPSRYVDLMTREWVRLTLINAGSLNGVFLAACRHLLMYRKEQYFVQLAIQYKLSCVQALRQTIHVETPSTISDSTIATGVLLAFDEVQIGDRSTLDCHLNGLIRMVEHNGGPESMGTNGFLERLVSKFTALAEPTCRYELQPW